MKPAYHSVFLAAASATGLILSLTLHASAENCSVLEQMKTYPQSKISPDRAVCTTFLSQSGQGGVSCHWEFVFRDKAANELANIFWAEILSCRAGSREKEDLRVNHPDSYDLREWRTEDATYRVSVKDKGALNRTLVFLRYELN